MDGFLKLHSTTEEFNENVVPQLRVIEGPVRIYNRAELDDLERDFVRKRDS